jgi:hypothetical protein
MAKQGKKKPAPKKPNKYDTTIKVNTDFEGLVNALANPKKPVNVNITKNK